MQVYVKSYKTKFALQSSDDGTPEFSGVGVWTPFLVPKQELESQELIPLRNQLLQRVDSS